MHKFLSLSKIVVGPRFREDYGDISDLCQKIRSTKGIKFNFVVVEEVENQDTSEKEYHLRAGGRRLQAYQLLASGDSKGWKETTPSEEDKELYATIPCTVRWNLTDEDRLIIEFVENMGRKDYTWQEIAHSVAHFHSFMEAKYGKATSGRGKTGWGIRDTAERLGLNPSDVVHYLKLAEGLKHSPSLQSIRQKSKALTKLRRADRAQIANLLQATDYSEDSVRLVCEDSKAFLPTLPDESFDMVITDPPWGISLEERMMNHRKDVYIEYDKDFDSMSTLEILIECYRLLKPNTPIYMFYSAFPLKVLEGVKLLEAAGFSVERIPLIWYKKHILSHDSRETRHLLNYEVILYGWKGERPFFNHPSRNILEHQVPYRDRIHASEKPESLLIELLELHTEKGAKLLDPFGGSCKLADACKRTLRKCTVVEKEKELVQGATLRLRGI